MQPTFFFEKKGSYLAMLVRCKQLPTNCAQFGKRHLFYALNLFVPKRFNAWKPHCWGSNEVTTNQTLENAKQAPFPQHLLASHTFDPICWFSRSIIHPGPIIQRPRLRNAAAVTWEAIARTWVEIEQPQKVRDIMATLMQQCDSLAYKIHFLQLQH